MEEKVSEGVGGDIERIIWAPTGIDHELEAEMLRRLMVAMSSGPILLVS